MKTGVPMLMRRRWRGAAASLSLILLVAISLLPAQQAPEGRTNVTYSVQSQLVQIYLTVTDGHRMVNELKASDFKLSEDGVLNEIHAVDSEIVPLHIALLLDTSESMRDALPFV